MADSIKWLPCGCTILRSGTEDDPKKTLMVLMCFQHVNHNDLLKQELNYDYVPGAVARETWEYDE